MATGNGMGNDTGTAVGASGDRSAGPARRRRRAQRGRRLAAVVFTALMVVSTSATTADAQDLSAPGLQESERYEWWWHWFGWGQPTPTPEPAPAPEPEPEPEPTVAGPGTIVAHQPTTAYLDPFRLIPLPGDVHRVEYTTTDRHGAEINTVAMVAVPHRGWYRGGPQPLAVFAPATTGLADHCAPSRLAADGDWLELVGASKLLKKGYVVVIPDYPIYYNRDNPDPIGRSVLGHTVLDAARAATRFDPTGLNADSPVVLSGYSLGARSTGAALELAPTYAPELNLVAGTVGAGGARIDDYVGFIDGGNSAFLSVIAMVALADANGLDLSHYLNGHGLAVADDIAGMCVDEATDSYTTLDTSTLTVDGSTIPQMFSREPWLSILNTEALGNRAPTVPVMMTHSTGDEVVPLWSGQNLKASWCAGGATVQFNTHFIPLLHIPSAVEYWGWSTSYLNRRLRGYSAPSNC